MAQPLLKRTFSRLRGRERWRRKSESRQSGERAHVAHTSLHFYLCGDVHLRNVLPKL